VKLNRQREFQRNERLEELLREINGLLGPVENEVIGRYRMPKYPVLFVVGAPRCGSTLMMQWLARTGEFAYPSNLLSRFYDAPYIGAKIQQLLTAPEYNFNNEILDFASDISFSSSLGKTRGALAPNEFWYFWRRFIPNVEPRYLNEEELEAVDGGRFAAELAAIEAVFDKPLAMKGLILELNIPFLSGLLDKALFVFVRRHPLYNIQSLLEARVRYFGDRRSWYSIKLQEYDWLADLEPIEQIAGQVYFTNRAIEDGLGLLDGARSLIVDYERFCAEPAEVFNQILDKLAQQGYHTRADYAGPQQFQSTNQVRLSEEDWAAIQAAYKRFSGIDLVVKRE
jgi:hypothetical protein